jgi:glycolate oxidase FAD binding subunit
MPDPRPATVADLCSLVKEAQSSQTPLYPRGGGTMLHYGLPAARSGPTVDLTALHQIIDYPARDMTITVQAGICLQQLHDLLKQENQRLPVDVPLPSQATLGGAIAANASGPRRFGCGTFRDYVLGISAVNDEGQEIKAGGRVVKNVAGYDLCKLFAGSFGTLGILTQATLKVRPSSEASALVGVTCPLERLADVLEGVHRTQTRPCAVGVLSPQTAIELMGTVKPDSQVNSIQVLIGFEDNAEAVRWQVQQVETELAGLQTRITGVWNGEDHALWAALRDYPLLAFPFTFLVGVPSSRVAEFVRLALPLVPRLLAHAGNGVVIGHAGDSFTREQLLRLRSFAEGHGGSLVLQRCPDEWHKAEIIWGAERGDVALMRRVKQQLDPHGMFNPGKFLVG